MHKTGSYIDLRIVFTHSFEHEIPNLVFNLVSLEKKFGAIVSWVLKIHAAIHYQDISEGGDSRERLKDQDGFPCPRKSHL